MKKIPSLFKRDYEGTRLVYDEVVEGCEWVLRGEGAPTIKIDGTCCRIADNVLFKRYDRKRNKKTGEHKAAPPGWVAAEDEPNEHTGHWPGWLPVGDGPEDKWHREAWDQVCEYEDGTYELVGPKVQSNPYALIRHDLWKHGTPPIPFVHSPFQMLQSTFEGTRRWLSVHQVEGIVWHHPDGRMCKIRRRDFGLPWPIKKG